MTKYKKAICWINVSIVVIFLGVIITLLIKPENEKDSNILSDVKMLSGTYVCTNDYDIRITFSENGTCVWSNEDIEFYDGIYDYVNGEYIITIYYKVVYDQQITFIYKAKKEGEYLYITGNVFDNAEFVPIN